MPFEPGNVGVITGAASGIGLALAHKFGLAGMRTVIADIEEVALAEAQVQLSKAGVEVIAKTCDVSQLADIEALAEFTLERFGQVNLIFNNAGVGSGGPSWELSLEDWKWVLDVDLWGVIYGIKVFTPLIIASGGGHVINTASMAGLSHTPYLAPYNVAKHGVVTLSETMFHELKLAGHPVGVTALCPGWVQTRIHESGRNRPIDAPVGAGDRTMKSFLEPLIANGLDPAAVAELTFEAVAGGQLYVFTHPQWMGEVKRHLDDIVSGRNPELVQPKS